jgi:diketogulonate reductase-like aldo/keto reductase
MTHSSILLGSDMVPVLGQGTWMMGDRRDRRADEVASLRTGLDLGLTLIDTAEMYANGEAERIVGEAIAGRRDEVYLVSKVLPSNADKAGVIQAAENSLRRMNTDRIDLYLLHWRGDVPLQQTIAGFQALQASGKIRGWGVSNFDVGDLDDLATSQGGEACLTNQILYNPMRRGAELGALKWTRSLGWPTMAYSPIEQGRLVNDPALAAIGKRYGASAAQVALAWTMRDSDVIAIPKTGKPERVRENQAALNLVLDADDLAAIDRAFPPPTHREPLEMI